MKRNTGFLFFLLMFAIKVFAIEVGDTDPKDSINAQILRAKLNSPAPEIILNQKLAALNLPLIENFDPIIIDNILADSIQSKRNHARTLKERVMEKQRFRDKIDNSALVDLPIGVVGDRGGLEYAILLDRIVFSEKGSFIEVFMSFEIPRFAKPLDFMGICQLTAEGGIAGSSKLYLIGDYPFDIGQGMLTIKGDSSIHGGNGLTFVEFDCNGFKGISLNATVEFSKNIIVAENEDGDPLDKRVAFDFATYLTDWSDFLIKITLPPFQAKEVPGLGMLANEVYLDWSEYANPPGFITPPEYQNPFTGGDQGGLWTGVFIRKATIRFPAQFKEQGDPIRRSIGAENLILDELGISGNFLAENLIRTGDLSGWGYSVDKINAVIQQNHFEEFSLTGRINVPAFNQTETKDKDGQESADASLYYTAFLAANGDYVFDVKLGESLPLNFWFAKLKLKPNSEFLLKVVDRKFQATVNLNGEMSIHAPMGKMNADLNGISFQNLILSNSKPYFRGGIFSFGENNETKDHRISGFPLTIQQIGVRTDQNQPENIGLQFGVRINLVPSEDEGFSGGAVLTLWGKSPSDFAPSSETGAVQKQKWKPEKVEVSAISIDIVKVNVFELKGNVQFFEGNETFGNGFKGRLAGKLGKVQVNAEALFGKNEKVRYWNANALVCIGNGIPIVPGFAFYGFGGGVYYRMKPAENITASSALGLSSSGVTYVPDEKAFLGLKASVFFGTQNKPEPLNGDATFEIVINKTGGINSTSITGNAYFMSPNFSCDPQAIVAMAKATSTKGSTIAPVPTSRAQVMGQIRLLYDNINSSLHGNIAVYVNAANGIVTGTGQNKRAGWAELHFAPDEWYVLLGTPTAPIGLDVAKIVKLQSYFMMGMNLPASPPPPDNVKSILRGTNLDYTRDMPSLEGGRAYAFGANYSVDTGDLKFLMFYGRFAAGAGFDLMLRDYGHESHCSGSTDPLGINGWYANGQAYAYLQGKIGIKVKLKFYEGDYDILKIGAAAILQAKGPNPFWMKGVVGGNYSILGGLVKGDCQFEVTVGKPCEIIIEEANALGDVSMIAEVSPISGEKEVNVFTAPQAAFNIPVEQTFEITDATNVKHSFRAKLDDFTVKNGSSSIPGQLSWNNNHDVAAFDSYDILPGHSSLTLTVKVSFEELVNGSWQKYKVDGNPMEELVQSVFETGGAPDFIPESNVLVSYPIAGQQNFYPLEYGTGFVQLKKGQPDLFVAQDGWTPKARLASSDGNTPTEFDFTYNNSDRKITFAIPPLEAAKYFLLQVIKKPNVQSGPVDRNVANIERNVNAPSDLETKVTTKDIEGKIDLGEAKVLYGMSLRTSIYPTFLQKLNVVTALPAYSDSGGPFNLQRLYGNLPLTELFDDAELAGSLKSGPLVSIESQLQNNAWYNNKIYPLIYEGYPLMGLFAFKNRTPAELGVPPIKSIFFEESVFNRTTQRKIAIGLYEAAHFDLSDLQSQIADYVVKTGYYPSERLRQIVLAYTPSYDAGDYPVKFRYTIPGINLETSNTDKIVRWSVVSK
jgi:hypothetical protein